MYDLTPDIFQSDCIHFSWHFR